ncbi:MAG: hypothetical protein ACPGNT_03480 [Rhodospirillales bacterium]
MIVQVLVLLLAGLAIAVVAIATVWSGAPPAPSSPRQRAGLIAQLPNGFNGTIIEAGAGFGGLAQNLARAFPEASVVAVEINPLPFFCAKVRSWFGPANLVVRFGDLAVMDLSEAGIITSYLGGKAQARLEAALRRSLRDDALVVSLFFRLPGWCPEKEVLLDDVHHSRVYLYRRSGAPWAASHLS